MEAQRASNGLVKVISSKTGSDGDQVPQTSSPACGVGQEPICQCAASLVPCSLGYSSGDPALFPWSDYL